MIKIIIIVLIGVVVCTAGLWLIKEFKPNKYE